MSYRFTIPQKTLEIDALRAEARRARVRPLPARKPEEMSPAVQAWAARLAAQRAKG